MHDYQHTQVVDVEPDRLFAYLSDVANLPRYFPRITSARQVEEDQVRTHAQVELPGQRPQEVEGTAWFRRDPDAQAIEWGSEGENDYHGRLSVGPASGGGSEVVLEIHTESGHEGIDDAIDETLDALESAAGSDA